MKKLLLPITAGILFTTGMAFSQTGIGTSTPDPSAVLEAASTSKGFLPPRMDEAQRDAIAGPAKGLMLYNLTEDCLQVNIGTPSVPEWTCVFGSGSGSLTQSACGTTYTYGTITSPTTNRIWLDRNLGATQVATSATDVQAYGHLYQWGRGNDGHQCVDYNDPANPGSSTAVNADVPGHNMFITEPDSPYDWRVAQDDALWNGVNTANNPCPLGFRIPTNAELTAEFVGIGNSAQAYGSVHKFVLAGGRNRSNASLINQGILGQLWSSSANGTDVSTRRFNSSSSSSLVGNRAHGFPVRCIKD